MRTGLDLARLWKYSKLISCCQWEKPMFPHWYILSTLSMLTENVTDRLPKVILQQMCQWTYVACKEIQGAFENFRIKSFFFLWNVSLLLSTRSASTLSKYVVRLSNAEIASLVSVHVWEQLFTLCTFIDTLISISAAHTHTNQTSTSNRIIRPPQVCQASRGIWQLYIWHVTFI